MGRHLGVAVDTDTVVVAGYGGPVRRADAVVQFGADGPVVGATAGRGPVFVDFTDRVGDPVPVVAGDGTARPGAALLATAVRTLAGPGPVEHLTVAHPSLWQERERAALGAALVRDGLAAPVSFVPRAVAATLRPDVPADATVLVLDVGEHTTEASLVGPGGARAVLASTRVDGLGAVALDRALLRLVLAASPQRLDRVATRGLAERCRAARRGRGTGPLVVDVPWPGGPVRIGRDRLDDAAHHAVEPGVESLLGPLRSAGVVPRLAVLCGDPATTAPIALTLVRRTGLRALPASVPGTVAEAAAAVARRRSHPPVPDAAARRVPASHGPAPRGLAPHIPAQRVPAQRVPAPHIPAPRLHAPLAAPRLPAQGQPRDGDDGGRHRLRPAADAGPDAGAAPRRRRLPLLLTAAGVAAVVAVGGGAAAAHLAEQSPRPQAAAHAAPAGPGVLQP